VGTERGGDNVAAGGRLGTPWRARGRAAGKKSRAGAGGDRRVEGGEAGGGAATAAERRPGARDCRWREGKQSRARARGRRREGRRSGGPVCENHELQGPLGKERFPTDLGV
jgi:hypothetical protein